MTTSPHDLTQIVVLARRASMSTSYKPALLKALVRIVRRRPSRHIALTTIGGEFVRMYWNQTVVFHLRQAAVLTKEPEVIKAIRRASVDTSTRNSTRFRRQAADVSKQIWLGSLRWTC